MEQIAINILPKGAKPVCHSSQFDEGRQIMFNLFNDDTPYTLSGTETISVLVRKPDGAEVIDSVTNTSDNYVIWDVSADACELSGVCECELSIVENGIVLGSKNFTMKVEEDAYGGRNIEVRTASGRIATFNTNMVEAFKSLKSDINPVQDLHGYSKPWSGGGGKNKLDYLSNLRASDSGLTISATSGGAIHYQGTAINNYCMLTYKFNLSIPSGTTITVSRDVSVGYQHYFSFTFTDNSIEYVRIMPNTTSTTYTLPKDLKNIDIVCLGLAVGTAYNATVKFQLEYGSQATSWEPYSNICPISGFSALNVTRTGKNLLSGTLEDYQASTRTYGMSTFIAYKLPNGTYTISTNAPTGYIWAGKSLDNGALDTSTYLRVYDGNPMTITLSGTQDLIVGVLTTDKETALSYNTQLELGNQASEYHAYNGQTATVNFGQTVYGGVADVTNGKVNVTHVIKNIGANDISDNGTSGGLIELYVNGTSNKKNGQTNMLCNNLEVRANASAYAIRGRAGSSNVTFCLPTSDVPDFNAAKTWVTNNPIELVYELANPIEITTTPENLTAISGENNVYGDTNGDTTVEYYIEV